MAGTACRAGFPRHKQAFLIHIYTKTRKKGTKRGLPPINARPILPFRHRVYVQSTGDVYSTISANESVCLFFVFPPQTVIYVRELFRGRTSGPIGASPSGELLAITFQALKRAGRKTRDLLELEKIMEDLIYGRLGSV